MSDKKRELTSWEKAECHALKRFVDAFNAGKTRSESLTQGKIAEQLDISQGSVSSYLNGYNALNMRVAGAIAGMIGIPVERFSPRLAKEIAQMTQAVPMPTGKAIAEKAGPYEGTSKAMPMVANLIASALATGQLTVSDGEELRRMALHLINKNLQATAHHVAVPDSLGGLADAALLAAENGDNPDDLLKMLEKGMSKQQPTEEPKAHEVREKRTR